MVQIVVSYRRNDTKWLTHRICEHLENRFGVGNVFLDIDNIPIGHDYRDHIRQTLDSCDILVAIVGPKWLERDDSGDLDNDADWVRLEISTALTRKIPVVPLLIDGTKMPKVKQLPEELSEFAYKQAGTFNSEDFKNQIARFVGLLDKLIQTEPTLRAKSNPEPQPNRLDERTQPAAVPAGENTELIKLPEVKKQVASNQVSDLAMSREFESVTLPGSEEPGNAEIRDFEDSSFESFETRDGRRIRTIRFFWIAGLLLLSIFPVIGHGQNNNIIFALWLAGVAAWVIWEIRTRPSGNL